MTPPNDNSGPYISTPDQNFQTRDHIKETNKFDSVQYTFPPSSVSQPKREENLSHLENSQGLIKVMMACLCFQVWFDILMYIQGCLLEMDCFCFYRWIVVHLLKQTLCPTYSTDQWQGIQSFRHCNPGKNKIKMLCNY